MPVEQPSEKKPKKKKKKEKVNLLIPQKPKKVASNKPAWGTSTVGPKLQASSTSKKSNSNKKSPRPLTKPGGQRRSKAPPGMMSSQQAPRRMTKPAPSDSNWEVPSARKVIKGPPPKQKKIEQFA